MLEPGSKVIIHGSAENKDQLKILANRISPLDDAAEKTSTGLRIYSNDMRVINDIKDVLSSEIPGRGKVSLVSTFNMKEIVIDLPGKFPASPSIAKALKAISGVDDVQEI